jgi:hypothetical protein
MIPRISGLPGLLSQVHACSQHGESEMVGAGEGREGHRGSESGYPCVGSCSPPLPLTDWNKGPWGLGIRGETRTPPPWMVHSLQGVTWLPSEGAGKSSLCPPPMCPCEPPGTGQ